jgi:hypothetical protein
MFLLPHRPLMSAAPADTVQRGRRFVGNAPGPHVSDVLPTRGVPDPEAHARIVTASVRPARSGPS